MAIVTSMEARNALFHIRLNRANQVKAYEIECKASNLNSNDTFLLVKEGGSDYGFDEASIAWVGKGGDDKEMEALQKLAEKIGATEIETIEEGAESDEFWELLGGQDEYSSCPPSKSQNSSDSEPSSMVSISVAPIFSANFCSASISLSSPPFPTQAMLASSNP